MAFRLALAGVVLLAAPAAHAQIPQGDEFPVHAPSAGPQHDARVAGQASGGFVVAWSSRANAGAASDVLVRRFGSDGMPLGGEVPAHATPDGFQNAPSLAGRADGRFVVAWESYLVSANSSDVYARVFDSAGVAVAPEFVVHTATTGAQGMAAVGMAPSGDFFVAFLDVDPGGGNNAIRGRAFGSDGTPAAPDFSVSNDTTRTHGNPTVAADGSGRYVVVWLAMNQSFQSQIVARRFDSAGAALGGEIPVSTPAFGSSFPAVAAAPDGRFLAVWGNQGRAFDANGAPVGSAFTVPQNPAASQNFPELAWDGAGFLVAWASASGAVVGRQFSSTGLALAAEFPVSATATGTNFPNPAVGGSTGGRGVVAWQVDAGAPGPANLDIRARGFLSDLLFRDGFQGG